MKDVDYPFPCPLLASELPCRAYVGVEAVSPAFKSNWGFFIWPLSETMMHKNMLLPRSMMGFVLVGRFLRRFRPPPWPNPSLRRVSALDPPSRVDAFLCLCGLSVAVHCFYLKVWLWYGLPLGCPRSSLFLLPLLSLNLVLWFRFKYLAHFFSSPIYTALLSHISFWLFSFVYALHFLDKANGNKPMGVSSPEPLSNTPRKGPKPSTEENFPERFLDTYDGGNKHWTPLNRSVFKPFYLTRFSCLIMLMKFPNLTFVWTHLLSLAQIPTVFWWFQNPVLEVYSSALLTPRKGLEQIMDFEVVIALFFGCVQERFFIMSVTESLSSASRWRLNKIVLEVYSSSPITSRLSGSQQIAMEMLSMDWPTDHLNIVKGLRYKVRKMQLSLDSKHLLYSSTINNSPIPSYMTLVFVKSDCFKLALGYCLLKLVRTLKFSHSYMTLVFVKSGWIYFFNHVTRWCGVSYLRFHWIINSLDSMDFIVDYLGTSTPVMQGLFLSPSPKNSRKGTNPLSEANHSEGSLLLDEKWQLVCHLKIWLVCYCCSDMYVAIRTKSYKNQSISEPLVYMYNSSLLFVSVLVPFGLTLLCTTFVNMLNFVSSSGCWFLIILKVPFGVIRLMHDACIPEYQLLCCRSWLTSTTICKHVLVVVYVYFRGLARTNKSRNDDLLFTFRNFRCYNLASNYLPSKFTWDGGDGAAATLPSKAKKKFNGLTNMHYSMYAYLHIQSFINHAYGGTPMVLRRLQYKLTCRLFENIC